MVEMNNGRISWIVISDDHPKVEEYLNDQEDVDIQTNSMPKINDLRSWNQCPWIPDDVVHRNVDL